MIKKPVRYAAGGQMDSTDTWNASVGVPDPKMYRSDWKNKQNVQRYIREQLGDEGVAKGSAEAMLNKFQAATSAEASPDSAAPTAPTNPRGGGIGMNLDNSRGLTQYEAPSSGIGGVNLPSLSSGIGNDMSALGRYTRGGTVMGGPPGVDTVKGKVEGGPEVRLTNQEYVLPVPVVKKVGKKNLDEAVMAVTGKPPVGYADGGMFSNWFKGAKVDRAKQIEDAVNGAVAPPPQPVKPVDEKPSGTSMADIMKEIRSKNPPVKYDIGGYVGLPWAEPLKKDPNLNVGAIPPKTKADIEADLLQREADKAAMLQKVEAARPVTPDVLPEPSMGRELQNRGVAEAVPAIPQSDWGYSRGSMGELVAKNPRGEATFYPGTGTGGASPAGFDAATMQGIAKRIASGTTGGGTVSMVSGPGSTGMSAEEWKALPNDQKIARNVKAYEDAAKAVRGVTDTQRAFEGRRPVGEEGTAPLKPSEQISLLGLLERAQSNAARQRTDEMRAQAASQAGTAAQNKERRATEAAFATTLENTPEFGTIPRNLLAPAIREMARRTGKDPMEVNQLLAGYLTSIGLPANEYKGTPEQYAMLQKEIEVFGAGLK